MKAMSVISFIAAAIFSVGAGAVVKYKTGSFAVDPMHSKVGFEIPHLVISSVEGHFNKFDGSIELSDKFEKSSVKASADVGSVDTGVGKRDDHLKSPDFFDAAKFPKMTFASTEIKGTPESFKMTGDLTIKGVTKKVTFNGKFMGTVNDGMGNEKAAFTATTSIKRADYGLTWSKAIEAGPVVGEALTINLKIEAAQPIAKK